MGFEIPFESFQRIGFKIECHFKSRSPRIKRFIFVLDICVNSIFCHLGYFFVTCSFEISLKKIFRKRFFHKNSACFLLTSCGAFLCWKFFEEIAKKKMDSPLEYKIPEGRMRKVNKHTCECEFKRRKLSIGSTSSIWSSLFDLWKITRWLLGVDQVVLLAPSEASAGGRDPPFKS